MKIVPSQSVVSGTASGHNACSIKNGIPRRTMNQTGWGIPSIGTILFFYVVGLAAGCHDKNAESAVAVPNVSVAVSEKLNQFEDSQNQTAASLCGTTPIAAELVEDACYYELAVDFSLCEHKGLTLATSELDALLRCWQSNFEKLTACCQNADGLCTYDSAESCDETLFNNGFEACVASNQEEVDAVIEACQENEASSAVSSSGTSEGLPRDICTSGAFSASEICGAATLVVPNEEAPNELMVATQQDLDALLACKCAMDDLVFSSDSLLAIQLPNLEIVTGAIRFENNPNLQTVRLGRLNSVGTQIAVINNLVLTAIEFSQLVVAGSIELDSNMNLLNIDGFAALTSLGTEQENPYVFILNNDALENLDGLGNVQNMTGTVYVENNASLTNIDGLVGISALESPYPYLGELAVSFQNNGQLPTCDITLFTEALAPIDGPVCISGNAADSCTEDTSGCQ